MTALAPRQQVQGGALAVWDRDQLDVIKTLICPGASDAELALFGQVCQKTGLDPFSRQIYGLMRSQRAQVNGEWKTIEKLSIQTSIDGFRLIAERSGKYGGQVGPLWCGSDGVWRDIWLDGDYPSAAKVGVIRADWKEPLYAVARWDSYVQTYKDRKSGQDVVGTMWQRMPDVMLAKVAESLALRRAFPAELSGLYTSEEMHQADSSAPIRTVHDEVMDRANARRVVEPDGRVTKRNDAPQPEGADEHPNLTAQMEAEHAADTEETRPSVGFDRAGAEAEYKRLRGLAVKAGHKASPKLKETLTSSLSDDVLVASIQSLEAWLETLNPAPADEPDDDSAPF